MKENLSCKIIFFCNNIQKITFCIIFHAIFFRFLFLRWIFCIFPGNVLFLHKIPLSVITQIPASSRKLAKASIFDHVPFRTTGVQDSSSNFPSKPPTKRDKSSHEVNFKRFDLREIRGFKFTTIKHQQIGHVNCKCVELHLRKTTLKNERKTALKTKLVPPLVNRRRIHIFCREVAKDTIGCTCRQQRRNTVGQYALENWFKYSRAGVQELKTLRLKINNAPSDTFSWKCHRQRLVSVHHVCRRVLSSIMSQAFLAANTRSTSCKSILSQHWDLFSILAQAEQIFGGSSVLFLTRDVSESGSKIFFMSKIFQKPVSTLRT